MLALYHPTEEAAAALLAAAASSRQELRAAAVESLAAMIRERPLRAVLAAMGGADEQAKAVAAEAVRAAGPQSTDALTRGLVDPDPLVRCGAIEALAVVPSEVSLQAISSLLRDPAEQVREQAARSLGSLGDGSNVSPQLLEALKDPSFAVQQAAALALARLGGDYLEKLLVALDERASEHPETRLSEPVLDAIVAFCPGPTPALVGALSSFNRSFAEGLAQALERAGVLDTWVGRLATASGQARQQILSALRAAMLVGITGPVLRNLSKAEVAVQEACIELLGDTGEKAAVGHLVAALQLAEARLRAAAAAALGKAGGGEAVAGLVAALSDPVPSVRAAAAASLAPALKAQASGAPLPAEAEGQRTAAEEGLIAALSDPVPEMRAAAAKTLAALGAEQAVAGIVQLALRDENDMVRASAAEALEQMLAYDALPLLMDAVNSPDPDMRARAIGIFARSGSLIATDVLIEALRDANPEVRGMAGRGLWAIASQGREQVANLLSYLKSPDPKVRASIAGIIGKLGAVEHAGALAAAVADPDPRVRASIVNAFAQMKEGAAPYLPVVMDRLRDTDAFVRARAVHALCAITPESEETARRLVEAASDPDSRVQEAVSSCLAKLVERGVHGPVIELLGTPGQERIALRALSSADEALLNDVLIAARSAPPELRQTAVEALADLFRRSWTTEAFEPELRSLDVHTRLAGLEGLAVIGTTEAKQTIARLLLTDPAPEVRLRAIEILSRTAEPNAEAALRAAAEGDPDPQVRDAAAAAIASLWLSEP
jgi:HEAT repeat protein